MIPFVIYFRPLPPVIFIQMFEDAAFLHESVIQFWRHSNIAAIERELEESEQL
jgi:hypothetical protein